MELHYTHTSSVLNMYDDYLSPLSACVLLPVSCVVRPAAHWPIIAGDDDICTVDSFQSNQSCLRCNQEFAFLQPAKLRSTPCPGSRETKGTVMEIASQAASQKRIQASLTCRVIIHRARCISNGKILGAQFSDNTPRGCLLLCLDPLH